ncbi:MAG: hypothetical protein K6B13_13145 [Prevotella sp.]|nr:hypothetical protein [Prevotella sp.]
MNIRKLFAGTRRLLMTIAAAVVAAVITACILQFCDERPHAKLTTQDQESVIDPTPIMLNITDSLALKGWLLATVPEGTSLVYAVVEGHEPLTVSDSSWQQFSCPLSANDTLRPKRNCNIMLRAETEGKSPVYTIVKFDFCAFVETAIRSQDTQLGHILRQLFQSYSTRHPLLISYDYTVEDECRDNGDRGLLDNFRLSMQGMTEGNVSYHIDSIRTYSTYSPMEEVLQPDYPPIAFINVNGNY